jgi:hypothetical protein
VTHNAATTYNFANDDRAPLLFISGGSDHILPPSVQRENYDKNVKHSTAVSAHASLALTSGVPGAGGSSDPPRALWAWWWR